MDITDTTQIAEAKWPLWAWCVGAAFAIVIGGGLGNWVGSRNAESTQAQASQLTVTPIIEAPAPATTSNVADRTAQPDPQIEIEPQSVRPSAASAAPAVRRVTPKQKPTPSKRRCNVYDHMDGC